MTRRFVFVFVVLAMLAALMVVLTMPAYAGPGDDCEKHGWGYGDDNHGHHSPGTDNDEDGHDTGTTGHSGQGGGNSDCKPTKKPEPTNPPPPTKRPEPTNTRPPEPTNTPPPQPSATPLPPTSTETPELVPSVVYCEAVPTATATILPESADGCYVEQVTCCYDALAQGVGTIDAQGSGLSDSDHFVIRVVIALVAFVGGVTFMVIMQIAANLRRRS